MTEMSARDQKTLLKSMSFKRSDCALACTLDILGDRWTLLIVRDLFFGKTRYKEFQQSPESIPSNILAARLKKLVAAGLVERRRYQSRPERYEYRLTATGRSLAPVIEAVVAWAGRQLPGTRRPGGPAADRARGAE